MLQIGRSLARFPMVSLEIFIDVKYFRSQYAPGVDSAFNINEYQGYFLGVKFGLCVGLTTLPTSWAVVMKSGNFKFLEPSGPVQACNGTALPLPSSKEVRGTAVAQWLRRCATNRKVTGSIPAGVTGIFH